METHNDATNGAVGGDNLSGQTKHETDIDHPNGPANGMINDPEKAEPEQPPATAPEIDTGKAPAPAPPKGPPMFDVPDGGTVAWLQVAGAWMLFFNTWGNLNTFGIFQTYYEEGQLFKETSSNIAWIGAIQAFLLLFVGSISGPMFDRGYLRIMLAIGSFLVVFGYMMLSICHTFWEAVLAQGFCIGIGGGFLFTPAVSLLPGYFRRHLGLAIGLSASGSSMGGVIFPIVFYRLVDRIGFGWTVRVIGFISLATLLLPNIVMKQRIKPPRARAIWDPTAFRDPQYLVFILGAFIGFVGLYVTLFYLSFFGETKGYTDQSLSFYIIPILNAASVFGRTIPNYVADRTGPFNVIGPAALICGLLVLCMLAVKNTAGILVLAAFFGFFSGVFVALPPVCFAHITADRSKIGTRIGMGFGFIAMSVLIGGPASGAILGTNNNGGQFNWTGMWTYGGVLTIASGCIFCAIRVWRGGMKLKVKV